MTDSYDVLRIRTGSTGCKSSELQYHSTTPATVVNAVVP